VQLATCALAVLAVTAAFGTAPPIAQNLRQSPTSDARQFVRIVKR
jgi:hypothetical protein